jgi:hypothetical protein
MTSADTAIILSALDRLAQRVDQLSAVAPSPAIAPADPADLADAVITVIDGALDATVAPILARLAALEDENRSLRADLLELCAAEAARTMTTP